MGGACAEEVHSTVGGVGALAPPHKENTNNRSDMSDTLRVTNIAPNGSSLQILGTSNFQTSSGVSAFTVGNDSSCIVHGDHWALGNVGSAGASGNWATFGQNWYNCVGYGSNGLSTVNYRSCSISWNGQYVLFTSTNTGAGPYFSNNGGRSVSLISPTASNTGGYWGSAMNASGQYVLVANTSTVWLSSNYLPMNLTATYSHSGYTSVLSIASTNNSLSMSASGQYCVFAYTASATTGGIYLSSNYGVTWTLVSGTNFPWTSVSMSSSGQYITACCNGTPNNIYISSNWGASFVLPTTSLSAITNWVSVKVSASAQWQVACANTAIYYSSNYGVTWTAVGANITLPAGTWGAVAISPNGKYMTATNHNAPWPYTSYIITNSNYGTGAWTQQAGGQNEAGYFMAISATGTIAFVSNGNTIMMSALSSTATHSLAPSLLLGSHPSVAANAMLTVNSTAGNGLIYLGTNTALPVAGFFGGAGDKMILYPGNASTYPYSIGISSATLWNSVPSGNQFQWFINGTSQMILNSSGNLGIGVSMLQARLHVSNVYGTGQLPVLGAVTNSALLVTESTNAYGLNVTVARETGIVHLQSQRVDTNATSYSLTLNSQGGNVGIGTVAPGAPLHVSAASNGSGGNGQLWLSDANNVNQQLRLFSYWSGGYAGSYGSINSTQVGNGATPLVLQATGGNVGIGTSMSPTSLLQVSGETAVNTLKMNAGGTAFQIARGKIAGGTGSGSVAFPFTFTNIPSVCCTFETASTTQVFSAGVSGVTTAGFNYVKTWNQTNGPGGAATSEPVFWIAIG
jgi:hypothetical protein